MAVPTSRSGRVTELQLWREQREISPDRNIVWSEPQNAKLKRVPVLYYLSRNGQLQHPHFMEVPLSSPQGLFLTDVIKRLNVLRGKGMASMYSWSCKRSYKNGFVWHDLSENDFIYPAHAGHEYVLKGSELLESMVAPPLLPPPETQRTGGDDLDYPRAAERQRRNQSCSSIDFNLDEYSVYKAESCGTSAANANANASTQTDDNRHRRRRPPAEIVEEAEGKEAQRDEIEISPPLSDSSPETLETLMKADGRLTLSHETVLSEDPTANSNRIGRGKSSVLMQLISCGNSISFKDCGAGSGMGLVRVTRGGRVKLEEKEYFSGSLVETTKKLEELVSVPAALKRSTSYNADRSSHLEVTLEEKEKEIEGVRAKCVPRKPKTQSSTTKQNMISSNVSTITINGCTL